MIDIVNDTGYDVNEARLQEAVRIVLARHEGDPESDLTIAFTDDESIADLNYQYRGWMRRPTCCRSRWNRCPARIITSAIW
ncbi:MAG: hypothetical protein U0703_24085 [Anaerolineae bacterium]